jgi:hypothetical protein
MLTLDEAWKEIERLESESGREFADMPDGDVLSARARRLVETVLLLSEGEQSLCWDIIEGKVQP